MPSFYCSDLDDVSQQITITGDEFHHLTHVLRHKIGDMINLNSGKGYTAKGTILSIDKKQAVIETNMLEFIQPDPVPFALAFSLLRNKKDEWLVEKVTELGVTDLFPMTTQFSVRTPSSNSLNRLKNTALSAIKQCDNPYLPSISDIQPLEKVLHEIKQKGYQPVVASEYRPDKWIDNLAMDKAYCFIIGPEGGFSPEEFNYIRINGAIEISLSKLVLRAETAAITIAAQYSLFKRLQD